jgi:hypothetical protein
MTLGPDSDAERRARFARRDEQAKRPVAHYFVAPWPYINAAPDQCERCGRDRRDPIHLKPTPDWL